MLAYLSLGSNLGDREENLRLGVRELAGDERHRVSPIYETDPVGGPEQGVFLNIVLELETDASPRALLERCARAEQSAQRVRTVRWGPRTLDCDVLLVGDLVVIEDDLVVPHPRMFERRFVLQPLSDLAPELVTERQLAEAVGEVRRVGTLS